MHNRTNVCAGPVSDRARQEGGFSLIELIVSMIIFLIVTGAIWGALNIAQRGRAVVNQKVDMGKSSRIGMNLLMRDTYNAGYAYPLDSTVVLPNDRVSGLLSIPADFDVTRDTVPPIIAGNGITESTFNPVAGVMTDQVTFLFKDPTFNIVGDVDEVQVSTPLNINAATTVDGIDEIVPIAGTVEDICNVNDIYLINGNTGSALGVATFIDDTTNTVQFSSDDPLNLNLPGAGGPLTGITTPASMLRVRMVTYFVTPEGVLTRREYGNAPVADAPLGYVDDALVYGVEDFQIEYVMDDGSLSDNPSAGADGEAGTPDDELAMLARIRQVRFSITVRSLEADVAGRPQRETLTSTFSTRNLGYDAN